MCLGGAWKGTSGRHGVTHFHEKCHRRPTWRKCVVGGRMDALTRYPPGPDYHLFGLRRRLQVILENKNKRIRTLICPSGHLSEQKRAKVFADLPLRNQKRY